MGFSNHLANQDYSLCVRRESGFCSIEWSTPPLPGYLSLSDKGLTEGDDLSSSDARIGDSECQNDFLLIPGGWGGSDPQNKAFSRDRFCGQALGYCRDETCTTKELGAIKSGVTPFIVGVVT